MIIVSDTSSLSALLRIGQLDLLKSLFFTIVIPEKVADELRQLPAFGVDISSFEMADWISIKQPTDLALLEKLSLNLDEGEAQAIALAIELSADWLIIDELKGRQTATMLSINIMGLGGVLLLAKREGVLPSVKNILDQILSQTSFRMSAALIDKIQLAADE
jgi:predicted nucleic acid-binding protein